MATVRLDVPLVRTSDGVYTLGEAADKGLIVFEQYKEYKRDGTPRVAYRARVLATGSFWEITPAAYASRTGADVGATLRQMGASAAQRRANDATWRRISRGG